MIRSGQHCYRNILGSKCLTLELSYDVLEHTSRTTSIPDPEISWYVLPYAVSKFGGVASDSGFGHCACRVPGFALCNPELLLRLLLQDRTDIQIMRYRPLGRHGRGRWCNCSRAVFMKSLHSDMTRAKFRRSEMICSKCTSKASISPYYYIACVAWAAVRSRFLARCR